MPVMYDKNGNPVNVDRVQEETLLEAGWTYEKVVEKVAEKPLVKKQLPSQDKE